MMTMNDGDDSKLSKSANVLLNSLFHLGLNILISVLTHPTVRHVPFIRCGHAISIVRGKVILRLRVELVDALSLKCNIIHESIIPTLKPSPQCYICLRYSLILSVQSGKTVLNIFFLKMKKALA